MTTNAKAFPGRSTHVFWIAFAASSVVLFLIAAAAFALAPHVVFAAPPIAATSRPLGYAPVHIAKPTYTPSPTPSPTPTTPPTATLEPTVTAALPIDTSIEMQVVGNSPA